MSNDPFWRLDEILSEEEVQGRLSQIEPSEFNEIRVPSADSNVWTFIGVSQKFVFGNGVGLVYSIVEYDKEEEIPEVEE